MLTKLIRFSLSNIQYIQAISENLTNSRSQVITECNEEPSGMLRGGFEQPALFTRYSSQTLIPHLSSAELSRIASLSGGHDPSCVTSMAPVYDCPAAAAAPL